MKRTPREQAELDMMAWLNDNNMHRAGSRIFDFGKPGLLQIWWARFGWETRWLEVEKPPEGINVK